MTWPTDSGLVIASRLSTSAARSRVIGEVKAAVNTARAMILGGVETALSWS